MNQNTSTTEDEIDLRELFSRISQGKKTIFAITAISIALSVLLALVVLKPTYEAEISFLSPSDESVIQVSRFAPDTKKDILYQHFLNTMTAKDFQKEVFNNGGYLQKLNADNADISDLDNYFLSFVKTLSIKDTKEKKGVLKISYENPVVISMQGGNPIVIADFLNELSDAANKEGVSRFLTTNKQKALNRLEEIHKQKSLLLLKAKDERLAQINRIKETNRQKINEINDEIGRLRIKAKKDRANRIQTLSDAAKVAGGLGIKDNNFKKVSDKQNSTLTVAIGDNQKLPKWYLYGESALLQEVELLKNRANDDPYVPKIVDLQSQLDTIKSDQKLKTLESRTDDSPFIAEIVKLDVEKTRLQSIVFDDTGINMMRISQHAIPPQYPIKPKKKLIVAVSAIAGLIFGVLWVLISRAFRGEDK